MPRILLALSFVLIAATAQAEPWYASGQTTMPWGSVQNPQPSQIEALGAVWSLPYVVPAGKVLRVDSMSMEAYDMSGITVILLFTGENAWAMTAQQINDASTGSCAARAANCRMDGPIYFGEGVTVNVLVLNGQSSGAGWVYGWQVTGELLDAVP